jgi:hypothetical protein
MIDEGDFWRIGGMKTGRGNWSTRRKPTPAPLCPPQNPTWQTQSRTPDCSGGKPATNRLSYGAAFFSPISSPLTTRRVTVEVFDPASTQVWSACRLQWPLRLDIPFVKVIWVCGSWSGECLLYSVYSSWMAPWDARFLPVGFPCHKFSWPVVHVSRELHTFAVVDDSSTENW